MKDSLGEIDPGSALRKASDSWVIDFQYLMAQIGKYFLGAFD